MSILPFYTVDFISITTTSNSPPFSWQILDLRLGILHPQQLHLLPECLELRVHAAGHLGGQEEGDSEAPGPQDGPRMRDADHPHHLDRQRGPGLPRRPVLRHRACNEVRVEIRKFNDIYFNKESLKNYDFFIVFFIQKILKKSTWNENKK